MKIPFENIRQINWHLSQEKASKLLLIQLKGGPKIYEKQNQHVDDEYENLSPVVDPPPEFDLPFEILFNVNSLVQNACLPPTSLDTEFYQFLDPKTHDRAFIDYALPKLLCLGKCSYEHVAWLTKESLEWGKKEKPMKSTLDYQRELFNIRRVKITPTRVYFSGLKPHESNRVFRVYQQFRHSI
ncbi:hypothetical protein YC2023_012706 [Brassica napus]